MLSPMTAVDLSRVRVAVTVKEACPVTEEPPAAMDFTPPDVSEGILRSTNILPSLFALMVTWVCPSRVILTGDPGPKPEPRSVTEVPGGPLEGEILKEDLMTKVRTICPIRTQ